MLMSDLSIIARHSRTFSERALLDYGLGFPEQLVLMYLANCANVNQETFANHFMIDKGSIAKTISKLEEKNLIERIENPVNKREKLIKLSADGAAILGIMEDALKQWNKIIYDGLTKAEISQYKNISGLMAANVAKYEGRMEHRNENTK